jgi:hypothetical protein
VNTYESQVLLPANSTGRCTGTAGNCNSLGLRAKRCRRDYFLIPPAPLINNVTAKKNADGSITINAGACDDGRINCIPITRGWNYVARTYRPQPEIVSGEWIFPEMKPSK